MGSIFVMLWNIYTKIEFKKYNCLFLHHMEGKCSYRESRNIQHPGLEEYFIFYTGGKIKKDEIGRACNMHIWDGKDKKVELCLCLLIKHAMKICGGVKV